MNAEINLLLIQLDVLVGLLRTTYDEYYALDAGLRLGSAGKTQVSLAVLERHYRECVGALQGQTESGSLSTEGTEGMMQ